MPSKAFSGKQKKEQLQAKRRAKQAKEDGATTRDGGTSDDDEVNDVHETHGGCESQHQRSVLSVFRKESTKDVEQRRAQSFQPILGRDFSTPGIPFGRYFSLGNDGVQQHHKGAPYVPLPVAIPTRAGLVASSFRDDVAVDDTAAAVTSGSSFELEEERVFRAWLSAVDRATLPGTLGPLELNSFERNIDVWRQLWRTVEQSDVVCIVADVRYPLVHVPYSLLYYVMIQQRKPVVVCLNKADLVPPSVVDAWRAFLQAYAHTCGLLPQGELLSVVTMTTMPEAETAVAGENLQSHQRRKAKDRSQKHYEEIRSGHKDNNKKGGNKVSSLADDLADLALHHDETGSDDETDDDSKDDGDETATDSTRQGYHGKFKGQEKAERDLNAGKRFHKELEKVSAMIDDLLAACKKAATQREGHPSTTTNEATTTTAASLTSIGLVGHPNVGKSSLLNAIRGTKVVSVSATAGHTKHLQNIPLASHGVVLVDCPGLAFPVFGLPKPLQAVIGTHQIAQTRDPSSGVAYLASRIPLERVYGLQRVDGGAPNDPWSSYDLCEAYAVKKGFRVKNGKGVADVHRAAIAILQEAYQGRLVLYHTPPPTEWLMSDAFRTSVRPYLLTTPIPLATAWQMPN